MWPNEMANCQDLEGGGLDVSDSTVPVSPGDNKEYLLPNTGMKHCRSSNLLGKAVPWLRRLVAGLLPRRPGFDPGSVHVRFVVEKVALGQVFPRVLRFSAVNFIPPVLH
jgi:hypothetical protein